ncbi:zinc ABC transporter substrate-binding protein [Pseudooceanicola sp. LIPI14-2-Ac024]|uniref:zinc ABC transporter substrate-binding protein n=1 Tax=Pseudooceanicola sp. LIPI14-2-Ac024 TaxID=3344875 RepID=UPI0035CF8E64
MRFLMSASLIALSTPVLADGPKVVADIAPVQSLVAQVMAGVGEPGLLIQPGVSPHGYALRPSEARMLSNADIMVWVGEASTPWLHETLDSLAPDAASMELLEVEGTRVLAPREGANFAAHDHDHDHGDHAEGAHDDDHADHSEEGHDHDHADHAEADHDHAEHADDDHDHAGHDHDDHAHEEVDPHAWLDPRNAQVWLGAIAEALAKADPANAATYRDNAAKAVADLDALQARIQAQIDTLSGEFVTFHDAYQYFETRFDYPAHGSLSASDAVDPGPARIAELHDMVASDGIVCLFAEPQFNPRQVNTLADDLGVRTGTLDPIGAGLEPGAEHYAALLSGLADGLSACLDRKAD